MKTFTIQTMSPQLPVADLDRAIRFYTEKLDFKLDFRYEDFYAGVVKDRCSVHLKLGESFQERTTEYLDLVFSVNDVERVYALLIDRGHRHLPTSAGHALRQGILCSRPRW